MKLTVQGATTVYTHTYKDVQYYGFVAISSVAVMMYYVDLPRDRYLYLVADGSGFLFYFFVSSGIIANHSSCERVYREQNQVYVRANENSARSSWKINGVILEKRIYH